jgi:hypothetical protein
VAINPEKIERKQEKPQQHENGLSFANVMEKPTVSSKPSEGTFTPKHEASAQAQKSLVEKGFPEISLTDSATAGRPSTDKADADKSGDKPRILTSDDLIDRPLTVAQMNQRLTTGKVTEDFEGQKELEKQLGIKIPRATDPENPPQRYGRNDIIDRPLTVKQMNQLLRDGSITEDPEGEKQLAKSLHQNLHPLSDWVKEHQVELSKEELKGRPLTARQSTEALRGLKIHDDPEGQKILEARLHIKFAPPRNKQAEQDYGGV